MEVITIEKKTYEAMMARFRILTAKVDALCRECDEKRMGRWLDNQDVCQILNISLRTLWKSHTNLTHPGKYFRPSKVKIMRPTSPK